MIRQIRLLWATDPRTDVVTWSELVPTPFWLDPIFWIWIVGLGLVC